MRPVPRPLPGRSARLPDPLAQRWAGLVGADAAGAPRPGALALTRLRRALDAHAREILPEVIADGTLGADGVFRGRVRLTSTAGPIRARVGYDLRTGHWDSDAAGDPDVPGLGRGVLDLLHWAWGGDDGWLSPDAAARRLLVRLGAAALEALSGTGASAPAPPRSRRGHR